MGWVESLKAERERREGNRWAVSEMENDVERSLPRLMGMVKASSLDAEGSGNVRLIKDIHKELRWLSSR